MGGIGFCQRARRGGWLPAVAGAVALAGCAAGPSRVEVTRFHLSQPLAGNSIAVRNLDATGTGSLALAADNDAVLAELVRAGFRAAPAGTAPALVASIRLERSTVEAPRRSGLSVGLGGGFGGRGGGVMSGVNVPVGGRTQLVSNAVLSLQIRRGSDTGVVWEGRAVASGSAADVGTGRLARALLTGFPGPSGQTVVVRPAR